MNKAYKFLCLAFCVICLFCMGACRLESPSGEKGENSGQTISGEALAGDCVKWIGRTEFDGDKVNCYYAATGFAVRVMGDSLKVTFAATNTDSQVNRPYISVSVDGEEPSDGRKFSLTESEQTVTVAEDLEKDKIHTVTVYKLNEAENSTVSVKEISTDGEFFKRPLDARLKFQILGGSGITGHGALGAEGEEWTTANSSVLCGFGFMAARKFGAETQFVSNSGMGLKWGYRGVASLIDAYEAVGLVPSYDSGGNTVSVAASDKKWDHTLWVPDAVIINIGGNDYNSHIDRLSDGARATAENEFKQAVTTLLDRIHSLYPQAKIVWTANSVNSGNGKLASDAINTLSYKQNICFAEISNKKDGADNHAGLNTQKLNATIVADAVTSAFGQL